MPLGRLVTRSQRSVGAAVNASVSSLTSGTGTNDKGTAGRRRKGQVQMADKPKRKASKPATQPEASSPEDMPIEPISQVPKSVLGSGSATALRLGKDFYDQDCIELCQNLLGTVLCRKVPSTGMILRGTIVEVEAYPGGDDRASQSYMGRKTPRNEAMFMEPGTAYVYITYGMYYCFNISSRGEGSACLLRAVEPFDDPEAITTMQRLRNIPSSKKKQQEQDTTSSSTKKPLNPHELANGPSKLCKAFDISRDSCDKLDMATSDLLWLESSLDGKYSNREFEIALDKRIGIDSTPPEARNKLWRFYIKDSWAESRAKIGELKKKAKLDKQA